MNRNRTEYLIGVLILALIAVTAVGCGDDGSDVETVPGEQFDNTLGIADVEVIARDSDQGVAHTDGDTWSGGLPPLHTEGDDFSFQIDAFDDNGEEIALDYDDNHDIRARIADDAEELIEIRHCQMRGCTIDLEPGERTGETAIHVRVLEDDEPQYESPSLRVIIEDGYEEK